MISTFQIDDQIFYCGEKFSQELNGKIGWVHSRVQNQEDTYIIWFPDSKRQDSYVVAGKFLTKYRPPKSESNNGPIIQPRRQSIEDFQSDT